MSVTVRVLLSCLSIVALAACDQGAPLASAPRPVMVVQPQRAADAVRRYPGEVRARYESALAFRMGGKVVERLVEVGQPLARGQALARLDDADLRLALKAAEARLAAAEADLRVARSERERFATLLERRLVSQSQFDALDNRYRAALATLEQARAEREVASNQRQYSVLQAPEAGVVAARMVEVGRVVELGDVAFVLAIDGEREVAIELPEQSRAELAVGQAARIELWSRPGVAYAGRIRELAPAANSASRTFAARVALVDPAVPVELGQSALVSIGDDSGAPLTLPLSAVSAEDGQPYVLRLRGDSTLERVAVRLGPYGERSVPVLEGLQEGDWVVRAGVHLVREGQSVRPLDSDNRLVQVSGN